MKPFRAWPVLALLLCVLASHQVRSHNAFSQQILDKTHDLAKHTELIGRQLIMQQFYWEEHMRSSGNSGVSRQRTSRQGTRPYYSSGHADAGSLAAMHDHANRERTLGMGEISAVLNGVEFRTRHTDYKLRMRHDTSPGDFADVELPGVPPEVTELDSVADQMEEMKEWFRAWRDQDYTDRDYRDYFKPILCYLEATWTHSALSDTARPFPGANRRGNRASWQQLSDTVKFTSYTGGKDARESLDMLPTTLITLRNSTAPVMAQWNYEILCHPLEHDVPINHLSIIDDVSTRMAMGGVTMEEYEESNLARYQVATKLRSGNRGAKEGQTKYGPLDAMMAQVPGREGYSGVLTDNVFDEMAFPFRKIRAGSLDPLNTAFYHRSYSLGSVGALGLKDRHRGFSDHNMFVAQTTDPRVAGLDLIFCPKNGDDCQQMHQKWSYAIPLEIVYATPLSSWNPYGLKYRGASSGHNDRRVRKGGRDGGRQKHKALNGVNSKDFYLTPAEFFADEQPPVHVLDRQRHVRAVRPSGFWIRTPEIADVGALRQRYPIMPLYEEGDPVWKELSAVQEMLLEPLKYQNMYREDISQLYE